MSNIVLNIKISVYLVCYASIRNSFTTHATCFRASSLCPIPFAIPIFFPLLTGRTTFIILTIICIYYIYVAYVILLYQTKINFKCSMYVHVLSDRQLTYHIGHKFSGMYFELLASCKIPVLCQHKRLQNPHSFL